MSKTTTSKMVCRLCLIESHNYVHICGHQLDIADIVWRHIQIQITVDDAISNVICQSCCNQLSDFHRFCLDIIEKQETLRQEQPQVNIRDSCNIQTIVKMEEEIDEQFHDGGDGVCIEKQDTVKQHGAFKEQYDIKVEEVHLDDVINEQFQNSDDEVNPLLLSSTPVSSSRPNIQNNNAKMSTEADGEDEPSSSSLGTDKYNYNKVVTIPFKENLYTLKKLSDTIHQYNGTILEALAEQKSLIKRLMNGETEAATIRSTFPITSEESLKHFENEIRDDNRDRYVKAIKSLFNGDIKKNIERVLHKQVIVESNVDGTHNKTALKNYAKFFRVLIDAIESVNAESELRAAMQLSKKRYFKSVSLKRPRVAIEK